MKPIINIRLTTNFKVSGDNKKLKNTRLYCKKFILFLYLLDFIFSSQVTIHKVSKGGSKLFNSLKAPYKNKMFRDQLTFNRRSVNLSIRPKVKKKKIKIFCMRDNLINKIVLDYIYDIFLFFNGLETNIVYIRSVSLDVSTNI